MDGRTAYENLQMLFAKSMLPSMLDNHPPFQIDGNFGGAAGVAEMLIQSHAGEIHLLPALPAEWPKGEVRGLRVRGGFEVDLSWSEGRLREATLRSEKRNSGVLRYGDAVKRVAVSAGIPLQVEGDSF
ncbi:hypothetical protein JIN87_03380 [Pelagicoccus mobilis]|uniref:Glycoside hydrolase family 95 protein n=4 Tax=Pelagicoccus mobilis TaxID=415221 RepID=A0A934RVG5_9BACT|nr:hypothetical protein [Pelagicoccus mobilis]